LTKREFSLILKSNRRNPRASSGQPALGRLPLLRFIIKGIFRPEPVFMRINGRKSDGGGAMLNQKTRQVEFRAERSAGADGAVRNKHGRNEF
jgi:hypothetical protein